MHFQEVSLTIFIPPTLNDKSKPGFPIGVVPSPLPKKQTSTPMVLLPTFRYLVMSTGSASCHLGSDGAGPHCILSPLTNSLYLLSATIQPFASLGMESKTKSFRKRTKVFWGVLDDGYQIHFAGRRSRLLL